MSNNTSRRSTAMAGTKPITRRQGRQASSATKVSVGSPSCDATPMARRADADESPGTAVVPAPAAASSVTATSTTDGPSTDAATAEDSLIPSPVAAAVSDGITAEDVFLLSHSASAPSSTLEQEEEAPPPKIGEGWIALPSERCRAYRDGRLVCNRIPCRFFHGKESALAAAMEKGHNAYRPADARTAFMPEEELRESEELSRTTKSVLFAPCPIAAGGNTGATVNPKLDWPVGGEGWMGYQDLVTGGGSASSGAVSGNASPTADTTDVTICATFYQGSLCRLGVACPFVHSPTRYRIMARRRRKRMCALLSAAPRPPRHPEGEQQDGGPQQEQEGSSGGQEEPHARCTSGLACSFFHGTEEDRLRLVSQGACVYDTTTMEAVDPAALGRDVRDDPQWWTAERLAELEKRRRDAVMAALALTPSVEVSSAAQPPDHHSVQTTAFRHDAPPKIGEGWIALPTERCRAYRSGRIGCNRIPCRLFHGTQSALAAVKEKGHNAYRPADGRAAFMPEEELRESEELSRATKSVLFAPCPIAAGGNTGATVNPKLDWPVGGEGWMGHQDHFVTGGGGPDTICATFYQGSLCRLGVACPFVHSPTRYRTMATRTCASYVPLRAPLGTHNGEQHDGGPQQEQEGPSGGQEEPHTRCTSGLACSFFHGTEEDRLRLVSQGACVYDTTTMEAVDPAALGRDVRDDPQWWTAERLAELEKRRRDAVMELGMDALASSAKRSAGDGGHEALGHHPSVQNTSTPRIRASLTVSGNSVDVSECNAALMARNTNISDRHSNNNNNNNNTAVNNNSLSCDDRSHTSVGAGGCAPDRFGVNVPNPPNAFFLPQLASTPCVGAADAVRNSSGSSSGATMIAALGEAAAAAATTVAEQRGGVKGGAGGMIISNTNHSYSHQGSNCCGNTNNVSVSSPAEPNAAKGNAPLNEPPAVSALDPYMLALRIEHQQQQIQQMRDVLNRHHQLALQQQWLQQQQLRVSQLNNMMGLRGVGSGVGDAYCAAPVVAHPFSVVNNNNNSLSMFNGNSNICFGANSSNNTNNNNNSIIDGHSNALVATSPLLPFNHPVNTNSLPPQAPPEMATMGLPFSMIQQQQQHYHYQQSDPMMMQQQGGNWNHQQQPREQQQQQQQHNHLLWQQEESAQSLQQFDFISQSKSPMAPASAATPFGTMGFW